MTQGRRGRIALLYDCTYPHVPGGGQKRLFEIFRRLVAKGWTVDWYGMKNWPGSDDPVIEGVRFIPAARAVSLYRADGKRSIGQTLHYGRAIASLPRLGQYDVIHMGQWPYFHFIAARFFRLFGGARISADWWEVWGSHWTEYYGTKGYLGMVLERLCAHLPDRIVAISEAGRRQLEGLGVQANRITVVHNGIDFEAIRTAPPATASTDLIYVGRLQPHKNVGLLVEALAILRELGHDLTLGIVGDGPERPALEALAAQRSVADCITWYGAVEKDADVYRLLRAARVFVHPSTKEGGGSITTLEANAAGLPVVAFAHPGGISAELIEEGTNGHWVTDVGAASLADGIAATLDDWAEASTRERTTRFAGRFDWSGLVDDYDSLLLGLIARRS